MAPSKPSQPFLTLALPYVAKLGMLLCAGPLFSNSLQILRARRSPFDIEAVIDDVMKDYPFKISRQQLIADISGAAASRWLGMHVFPVALWLILAILQHSSWIRKRYLGFHRMCGRVLLAVSTYMMLGVALMVVTGERMHGTQFAFSLTNPASVFTFKAATILGTLAWALSIVQTYRYASFKTIHLHKFWASQLTAIGFGTGTMRLMFFFYCLIRFPRHGEAVMSAEAHSALLGYTLWAGFAFNLALVNGYRSLLFRIDRSALSKWS